MNFIQFSAFKSYLEGLIKGLTESLTFFYVFLIAIAINKYTVFYTETCKYLKEIKLLDGNFKLLKKHSLFRDRYVIVSPFGNDVVA